MSFHILLSTINRPVALVVFYFMLLSGKESKIILLHAVFYVPGNNAALSIVASLS
jgi:hypothetical protein